MHPGEAAVGRGEQTAVGAPGVRFHTVFPNKLGPALFSLGVLQRELTVRWCDTHLPTERKVLPGGRRAAQAPRQGPTSGGLRGTPPPVCTAGLSGTRRRAAWGGPAGGGCAEPVTQPTSRSSASHLVGSHVARPGKTAVCQVLESVSVTRAVILVGS